MSDTKSILPTKKTSGLLFDPKEDYKILYLRHFAYNGRFDWLMTTITVLQRDEQYTMNASIYAKLCDPYWPRPQIAAELGHKNRNSIAGHFHREGVKKDYPQLYSVYPDAVKSVSVQPATAPAKEKEPVAKQLPPASQEVTKAAVPSKLPPKPMKAPKSKSTKKPFAHKAKPELRVSLVQPPVTREPEPPAPKPEAAPKLEPLLALELETKTEWKAKPKIETRLLDDEDNRVIIQRRHQPGPTPKLLKSAAQITTRRRNPTGLTTLQPGVTLKLRPGLDADHPLVKFPLMTAERVKMAEARNIKTFSQLYSVPEIIRQEIQANHLWDYLAGMEPPHMRPKIWRKLCSTIDFLVARVLGVPTKPAPVNRPLSPSPKPET